MRGELVVVDDVLEHIATDLEGGYSGRAVVMGDAVAAHGVANSMAAAKAEAVAGVVLVANVERTATKVVAIYEASEPGGRNSCKFLVGSIDLLVKFCRGVPQFGGNFFFDLEVFIGDA